MSKLIDRAKKEGTPLIDGETVTFVWSGKTAPQLVGDWTDWEWGGRPITLTKEAAGVWSHQITLPRDTYLEYAYIAPEGRVRDPFNPRLITNGMGKMNHYFTMPDGQHTTLVRAARGIKRGKVSQQRIAGDDMIVGQQRTVYLYQPPTDEPCPLLMVLDGKDYFTRAKLPVIVDNLIAQGRIRPIAIAAPQHGGPARMVEYLCSDATLRFLTDSVLKLAQQHLKLVDIQKQPGTFGILGASMGGLMALYTGLRLPHIFGKVISQSGAFGFELPGTAPLIYELLRSQERLPLSIWMDVGRYEWLLDLNRAMRAALDAKGYAPIYREYNGGHNYTLWRDEVVLALEAQFGAQA